MHLTVEVKPIVVAQQDEEAKERRPNRAWTEERRTKVLRTAGDLFLEQGYAGVSLEKIVAITGGSFRDLYREFGDKEALFRQIMEDVCAEVLAPLRQIEELSDAAMPLEQALVTIGKAALRSLLLERVLALHRLVISEAARFPELSVLFLEMGPQAGYQAVSLLLERRLLKEGISLENVQVAARLFVDMITGDLQLRALTGVPISPGEINTRVHAAVTLFLSGVRNQR